MNDLYTIEIEAALDRQKQEKELEEKRKRGMVETANFGDEEPETVPSEAFKFGGNGGNITDMRFIRFKIKSMTIEDGELFQTLVNDGFKFNAALPLPDVHSHSVKD